MKKLIPIIFFISGCATLPVVIEPIKLKRQEDFLYENKKIIISQKENSSAMVYSYHEIYYEHLFPRFVLVVNNESTFNSNITTGNIEVLFNGETVKVFSYNDLLKIIEKERAMKAFALLMGHLGDSINAQNAGRSYSSSYHGYQYSNNNFAQFQAQQIVNQNTMQNANIANQNLLMKTLELSQMALKDNTISPGDTYGGFFQTEKINIKQGNNDLLIKVKFSGDIHTFSFKLKKE